tara:strand:- start:50 stop:1192 length:1143 start_codon:yes stop_codon:yes gene_type:complete
LDASSQWTQRTDFGGVGRHRATGLSIGNRAYMGIGHYNGTGTETLLSDWWEYDPATNAWTQKADYLGNNGNGEVGAHGFGLELVGYVGLGKLDEFGLYKYDPATNTWAPMTSAPAGGSFQDRANFTIGHKAYFLRLYTTRLWEYNADLNIWKELNPVTFNTFNFSSGFSIYNKGYLKTSNSSQALNEFWKYDSDLDSWDQVATYPGDARLGSVAFVQDDKGYIICGYGAYSLSNLSSQVWQYRPITDSWFRMDDFPGAQRRFSIGLSIGERCYLGTGTNGTNLKDFWEFDASGLADISEEFDESSFSVYPNPAVDFVEFHSEKSLSFDVIVFDALGKMVNILNTENGSVRLNRNSLPGGCYFFQVEVDGEAVYSDRFDFL